MNNIQKYKTESKRVPTAWVVVLTLGLIVAAAPAIPVFANPPQTATYFICPSVSTHNSSGMWVVGAHGGYYVLVPSQGGANGGSKVYLTVPVRVASQAQIPAGWALYKAVPSYPNFEGMAVLLAEGISTWLGSPAGWQEGDMASVTNNGNGTYTVTNMRLSTQVQINAPIPLASAAVW